MSESSTSKDDAPPVEGDEVSPAPRRRSRIWWWLRAGLLLAMIPVLTAAVAAVMLIGREVAAPSWVVRDVEARAAQVLAGGSIAFDKVTVTVGEDLHPRLVVRDAVMRDAGGEVLARVPRVEALVSPRGVLQGRVLAQEIVLRGAQVSLRRSSDGTLALAFDQAGAQVGRAEGFVDLLDQVDQVFEASALEALEQVRADGLIINYVDARAGRSWIVDDGRIALDLRGGALELRANVALLSGRNFVTTAELTYTSPRGARSADIGVSIREAAAADLASQSPVLSFLQVLEAPISGSVRGRLDERGELTGVSATLQIGQGELRPNRETRPIPFEQARTYLTFDPDRDRLTFDLIEVDSDWGRIQGRGQTYLREYDGAWPQALLGQLELDAMSLAAEDLYADPVVFTGGAVDFRLRLDPFSLDIGQAVMMQDATPVHLDGRVVAASEGWQVGLDIAADEIVTDRVLALWPDGMAERTRAWLRDNVSGGTFYDLTFVVRSRPDQPRPVTALAAEFRGVDVAFLPSLPPITAAQGRMSIADARFALTLEEGRVQAPQGGALDMAGSTMVIPQTGVPRAPAEFDLAMQGRVTAAMSVLSLPPFNLFQRTDLPVDFAQGRAEIDVELSTPLGRGVTPKSASGRRKRGSRMCGPRIWCRGRSCARRF